MSNGFEGLANRVCSNRLALDGRVIKVKLAGEVQCFLMGAAGDAMATMRAIRAVIQSGFGLTDADALAMKCQYLDEEGDFCTLNRLTLAHWTQQDARGPLRIHVSLRSSDVESSRQSANVPNDAVNAVPEYESPKLGNEAEAEARDVRRDKTKFDQSAGLLGTVEVERLRYAAWQGAGSQARPRSPIPTVAGRDADWAVKTAEKEALDGVKAEVVDWIQTVSESPMSDASYAKWLHDGKALCALINAIRPTNAARDEGLPEYSVRGTLDQCEEIYLSSVARCIHALGGAVKVNVPEVMRPELGTPFDRAAPGKAPQEVG